MLATSSSAVSSNTMATPGSPNCVAPRTRNCMASRVLPDPAPPATSDVRPLGTPPMVMRSSPAIPVGHLGTPLSLRGASCFLAAVARIQSSRKFKNSDGPILLLCTQERSLGNRPICIGETFSHLQLNQYPDGVPQPEQRGTACAPDIRTSCRPDTAGRQCEMGPTPERRTAGRTHR